MMEILVGYTGFVGSNICSQHKFDKVYNSKNIQNSFGLNPDLCVYAGVPAEKFLANKNPKMDLEIIKNAFQNIKKINPKKLVLISTIDVFENSNEKYEDVSIDQISKQAYGRNRYYLEKECVKYFKECSILRLPGLFGNGLKKNFIFDLINLLPSKLNIELYKNFSEKEKNIGIAYKELPDGFYQLNQLSKIEKEELVQSFNRLEFSALDFTDSRSKFQFYNLKYIWSHIEIVIDLNIPILHLAVEPVSAAEIYRNVNNSEFKNIKNQTPVEYNFKTKYEVIFSGDSGYIFKKSKVLEEINNFVKTKREDFNKSTI